MRRTIKSGLAALVGMCLVSCNFNQSPPAAFSNDKLINKNNIILPASNNAYTFDVGNGKKGTTFSTEIKFAESSAEFKTAANSNGTLAKSLADIQSYDIYLISNAKTDGYPSNGDPLGSADRVSGPFTVTKGGSPSITVYFSNVISSGTKAYYVAVRLKDSLGSDLIKANNGSGTAWTGTTANTVANGGANGQVAVSSGNGIVVDPSSLVVSSTPALTVVPKLLDATGAIIQADIIPSPGSSVISTISSFVVTPFIGEFKVAAIATTAGSAGSTAIAKDSSGNFVIAWDTFNTDGDRLGIYARKYNVNGFAQLNEFKVNTTVTSDQALPSVAMDSTGNFVIAWQSNGQDGGGYGIYAQRYNAAGTAQGGEFLVNTTTANTQVNPSVAMDSSGNFIIAWEGNGPSDSSGVFAQRYNADGSKPSTNGAEFKVNTTTANTQANPSAAMDSSGNFIIAWQSDLQDLSNNGIYAQRYNATGAAQLAEFRVNVTTVNNQKNPAAAMDGSGNFIIAWDGNGPSDSSGVFAQRYNTSGTVQVAEFRVNTQSNSAQSNPSVAARDAAGNFVIAWESSGQDVSGTYGIYGQRYNAAGSVQGAEFLVNTTIANDQKSSAAVMDSTGDFVIAWKNLNTGGSGLGTYAQRYTATGVAR
jgi:hypothetical protein